MRPSTLLVIDLSNACRLSSPQAKSYLRPSLVGIKARLERTDYDEVKLVFQFPMSTYVQHQEGGGYGDVAV
ncbi:hypothetical protein Mp_7g12010 [Marchantia polymorpha subsp. ruderalis]|uniref:Uncharacterized protein n=2 Tax=Marchantia polymorpha TaxID=3197 RepID=A0AAF6BYL9_MARPO|nr:hypothetical protein MARPO_0003s0215 [Marchantia polymorpha]PTQ49343.1 hypothetical protein MARPO_0003s0216 [Marchantia polymorpha]BBN17103.1 hypothetical protein Mp_7g12010 [Marchantia polymorpha subsp. ruderalis]|eukprot:PTQ49342.1 hypothetical protein MARPO_0003s0215 [Marchantia polymorpha]